MRSVVGIVERLGECVLKMLVLPILASSNAGYKLTYSLKPSVTMKVRGVDCGVKVEILIHG